LIYALSICCNLSDRNNKQAEYWVRISKTTYSLLYRHVRPALYRGVHFYNRKTCDISWYTLKTQLPIQSKLGNASLSNNSSTRYFSLSVLEG